MNLSTEFDHLHQPVAAISLISADDFFGAGRVSQTRRRFDQHASQLLTYHQSAMVVVDCERRFQLAHRASKLHPEIICTSGEWTCPDGIVPQRTNDTIHGLWVDCIALPVVLVNDIPQAITVIQWIVRHFAQGTIWDPICSRKTE